MNNNLPQRQDIDSVSALISQNKENFRLGLANSMDINKFMSMAYNLCRFNPALLSVPADTLINALLCAAELGLEPGFNGYSYIIPRYNKKTGRTEANFQPGYKGLIKLFYNHPQADKIEAYCVYEADFFDYELGLEPRLKHKPALTNKGKVIAYYAIARFKSGTSSFVVMNVDEIKAHCTQYAGNSGTWQTSFDEMAKKTVIAKVLKYMPKSSKFEMLEALENLDKEVSSPINYNPNTGEIFEDEPLPEITPALQRELAKDRPSQEILKRCYEANQLLNSLIKWKKISKDELMSYEKDIEVFKFSGNENGLIEIIKDLTEMTKYSNPNKEQKDPVKAPVKSAIEQTREAITGLLDKMKPYGTYGNEEYVENYLISAIGYDNVSKCTDINLLAELLEALKAEYKELN